VGRWFDPSRAHQILPQNQLVTASACLAPDAAVSVPGACPENAWSGRSDAFERVSAHIEALIGARAGAAVIPLRG
jgi:hypothetical protein